jgi:hypothetical protein
VGQEAIAQNSTFSTGTLILSVRSARCVYLASDSRRSDPLSDSAQKIFRCGDFGFVALCGTVAATAALPNNKETGTLDPMAMLNTISCEYDGVGDLVQHVVDRSYATLKEFWERYVEPSPGAFWDSGRAHKPVCTMPTITRNVDMIEVHEIQFPVSESGILLYPKHRVRNEDIICWGQRPLDADEILFDPSSMASILSYIDAIYSRSAFLYPQSVGGHTDIGCVNSHGSQWIRRKDFP